MMEFIWNPNFLGLVAVTYLAGALCACSALLKSRTPQGATAWVVSLITLPLLTVPLFFLFGRSKFRGYNILRRELDRRVLEKFEGLNFLADEASPVSEELRLISASISDVGQAGFTAKNTVRLLENASEAYPAMIKAIENAENYIVFQFYVFRKDDSGRRFKDLLVKKARQGVRVSFLHDEIGSRVPKSWNDELVEAGVKVGPFNTSTGRRRMQVNFRNHRKIVIVDGKVGFIGGLNIGDEYLGLWPKIGDWRDTHLELRGPSVIATQLAAAKDWFWAQQTNLDVDWKVHAAAGDCDVLVLHTGPADDKHTCLLAHLALINSAKHRLFIANPYLVPPESLLDAIFMAALRGVDVRVIVPANSDSPSIHLASYVYQERLLRHGVQVLRYEKGFMHQKVMVIDDKISVIGSANFDCRSMFINFEIIGIVIDEGLNRAVTGMLERDLERSRRVDLQDFENGSLLDRLLRRGANLFAPML